MPFIVTIPKKSVRIENDDIKKIISYLNEALTNAGLTLIEDNKQSSSEIAPGEQRKRDGWWVSLVTQRLESITGHERGSKECIFPYVRMNLDPPAMMLRESYIDYLNILLIADGRSIEETENELIKSRTVLTREILIRMVTIALCTDMDASRDGEKIVKAIKNFCNLLTENGVLHKSSFIFFRNASKMDISFETGHARWLEVLEQMILTIKSLHAHTTALSETLNHLLKAKYTIARHIISELNPKINPDELADNWLRYTLIKSEENFIVHQQEQSIALWVGRISDWDSTQQTERQKQVITYCENHNKGKLRIAKLYELLQKTNLLMLTVGRVDLLLTATGWVPLLTGVLNVDALAKLIQEHGTSCKELLTLESTDPVFRQKAGEGLIKYHAGTGFQLASRAIESSHSLIALSDERLLKKIGTFIFGNIEGLLLLQPQLKCQIVDKTKFSLLHSSPLGQEIALAPTLSQIRQSNDYLNKTDTLLENEIPSQNILHSKINITNLPKNYTITLPDGKEILIEGIEEASSDGNCGFRAILGDAYLSQASNLLSRQGVVEILVEYLVQPQIKALIAIDIKAKYNEYISNVWNAEDTKLFPEKLKKKFDYFKAKTVEVGKYKPSKQKAKFQKIEDSINKYCLKDKTLKIYLKQYIIHKSVWPHAQGCLAAFGQILQIKIHCLQLQAPDSKHHLPWLRHIDLEQNKDLNYKEETYIILNQQGTHFDRLKIRIIRMNNQLKIVPIVYEQQQYQDKAPKDNKLLMIADNLLPIARGLITHKPLPQKTNAPSPTSAVISHLHSKSISDKVLSQLFKSNIYKDMTKYYKEVAALKQQEMIKRENQYKELTLVHMHFEEESKSLAQLCIKNDINAVQNHLFKYKNKQEKAKAINEIFLGKRNAFHHACATNNTNLLKLLLDNGADITKSCLEGYYVIHHVILSRHDDEQTLNTLQFLKQSNPQLIEIRGEFGRTPLHTAAHVGNLEICKWLIGQYVLNDTIDKIINLCEQNGKDMPCNRYTALQIAACRGNARIVRYLLMVGANASITDAKNRSAQFNAVSRGFVEVAQEFYDNGIWLTKSERKELLDLAEKGDKAVEACLAIPLMNMEGITEINYDKQEINGTLSSLIKR